MKILTKLLFCIFVIVLSSCEPEELSSEPVINSEEIKPGDIFGDTGGNEEDVIDDKKD